MALTDWELWAIAVKVLDAEGDHVGDFIVDRINTLSKAGDHEGVAIWLAVADRVQRLYDEPDDPKDLN
jgi:hypothetical protein